MPDGQRRFDAYGVRSPKLGRRDGNPGGRLRLLRSRYAGIGVCSVGDVAFSVLATVIGHQRAHGRITVDAGWMAMSRDR